MTKETADFIVAILQRIVSWPAAILIIAIFFREQIKLRLLNLTKAKLGEATFEFEAPKTTETVIGKTNVSAIPTKFEEDSLVFRSKRFGLEISYPVGNTWVVDHDPQNQFLAQVGQIIVLSISAQPGIDGFSPNVAVLVQPVGNQTVIEYMADSIKTITASGGKLLLYDIDDKTNGASFSYVLPIEDKKGCFVGRVTISRGLAFLATSTTLEGSPIPPDIRDNLNAILNSFHVISSD